MKLGAHIPLGFHANPHSTVQLPPPGQFIRSVFMDQAVSVWASYYNMVIVIHRPFITGKSSPLTGE